MKKPACACGIIWLRNALYVFFVSREISSVRCRCSSPTGERQEICYSEATEPSPRLPFHHPVSSLGWTCQEPETTMDPGPLG